MVMKMVNCTVGILLLISLSVAGYAQSQFSGRWQTKISPVTGKPAITISIVETGNKLSGTIVLTNPNGTQSDLPIMRPVANSSVLQFYTEDTRGMFQWRLTIEKSGRTALLHGSDPRPANEGGGGEMAIEEKLRKEG